MVGWSMVGALGRWSVGWCSVVGGRLVVGWWKVVGWLVVLRKPHER